MSKAAKEVQKAMPIYDYSDGLSLFSAAPAGQMAGTPGPNLFTQWGSVMHTKAL
jgi:hypothetical protein